VENELEKWRRERIKEVKNLLENADMPENIIEHLEELVKDLENADKDMLRAMKAAHDFGQAFVDRYYNVISENDIRDLAESESFADLLKKLLEISEREDVYRYIV